MICCFEVLLDLYIRMPELADLPGCVFFRHPWARDLLLVPVGCDLTVDTSLMDHVWSTQNPNMQPFACVNHEAFVDLCDELATYMKLKGDDVT